MHHSADEKQQQQAGLACRNGKHMGKAADSRDGECIFGRARNGTGCNSKSFPQGLNTKFELAAATNDLYT